MAKVVLVGCGAVGMSFLYSSMNQEIASEYVLIDAFENTAIGNALDCEDAIASLGRECRVKKGDYSECSDADFILIAAGRPQAPGETRLNMVKDNVKIMKEIALNIKSSGFKGITLICANPVDVLTYAYQKYTGFSPSRVIGSGTALDTARLKIAISKDLKVSTCSVQSAYVIAEHGDSSVTVFSNIRVSNKTLKELNCCFTEENYEEKLERYIARKAYEIIEKKRATFYGIGAAMACILKALVHDTKEILVVGSMLSGEYGQKDISIGVPCVIGAKGIEQIIELNLNSKEKDKFAKSCEIVRKINIESVV